MLRRAMPVRLVLALPAAMLIATPPSSLAGEGSAVHAPSRSNISTAATRCGAGDGAKPNAEQCIEVTASGFLGGELVVVREFRRPGWQLTVRADGLGRVGYRLPPSAGNSREADVLTFVGLGTASPAGTTGTLQVSVPRTAIYRFGTDADF